MTETRRRQKARSSARRLAAAATAVVVCVGVASVARAGEGSPPARVDLRTGSAWVGSSVGLMTLIDGDSGEVEARVDIGAASGSLVTTQYGPVGYAVNGDTGAVVRIDPRTFVPSSPVPVLERASGHVSARATGSAVYVLDEEQGRVAIADPDDATQRQGRVQSLAEPVASSTVDHDSRLWLLGSSSGDLAWFDGAERHDRANAVAHPEGAVLVVAGGSPVVVDPGARTMRRLTAAGGPGREGCLDVAPGDASVRFGGSSARPRVYSISGDQGVLRVSDLDSGACKEVAISVFPGGNDLGDPLESQGRVFVPNFTTGTVAIVDVADSHVAETPDAIAGGHFELFDRDGTVFYNDPDSDQAGVIHLDGTVTPVAKYNPEDPSEDVINAPHPQGANEPASPSDPDEGAPPPPAPTDPGARPPPSPPSAAPVPGNPRGPDAPRPPSTTPARRSPANRCPIPNRPEIRPPPRSPPSPPTRPPAPRRPRRPARRPPPLRFPSRHRRIPAHHRRIPAHPHRIPAHPHRTPDHRPTPRAPNCRSGANGPARTSISWWSRSPTGAIPAES
jgi:hypothetical protein